MKCGKLYILSFLVVLLILVSSCSRNKPVYEVRGTPSHLISYPPLSVPEWVINLPSGDYAIGIAWNNEYDPSTTENYAREFAAISLSRNHSSFVVDKKAILDIAEQKEIDYKEMNFKVVVSADTAYLNYINEQISPIASTTVNAYKLYLFGTKYVDLPKREANLTLSDQPDWIKNPEVSLINDDVYVIGYSHQADLIIAWKEAQENALANLAKYRLQKVAARIRSLNDNVQKALLLETVVRSPNASLVKSWFYLKKINDVSSYGVYVMLKVNE